MFTFQMGILFKIICLVSLLPTSLLSAAYNDLPWTQAMAHFNQITESVTNNKRDIWDFEIRIIEDIKAEVRKWCKQGIIRVYRGSVPSSKENTLGISTKNYVVTLPRNPDEENYAWRLPAVQCRATVHAEILVGIVPPKQRESLVGGTNTEKMQHSQVNTQISGFKRQSHEKSVSSSSSSSDEDSEEDKETINREKQTVLLLEKLILESNRLSPFEVDEDVNPVNEEDLDAVEAYKSKEQEHFATLEVLVINAKTATTSTNQLQQGVSHQRDNHGDGSDRTIASIAERERDNSHSDSTHSEQMEMGSENLRRIDAAKNEHDHYLGVAKIKRTKDQKASQRNFADEKARKIKIETLKRNKDYANRNSGDITSESKSEEERRRSESRGQKVGTSNSQTKIKRRKTQKTIRKDSSDEELLHSRRDNDYHATKRSRQKASEAESEDSSNSHLENNKTPIPEGQTKELFTAQLTKHFTFRRRIKKPSQN